MCWECLNTTLKQFNNAVVAQTGCCTVKLDTLEEKILIYSQNITNVNPVAVTPPTEDIYICSLVV